MGQTTLGQGLRDAPGAARLAPPRRRTRLGREQARAGYLFVAPAMVLFFVFALLPAVAAIGFSFTDYDILTPTKWVGSRNYVRLWHDALFRQGLRNVFTYSALYVPSMIALSLVLALALNRQVPGMKVFRTIYYFPMVTSSVAAATVWIWMLNKDYGPINQFLEAFGINGPAWLANDDTAMLAIVLITVWQGLGGNMIVYLAGLQGIPTYLYEAALLDGASAWQSFRDITWPSLRTTTLFVTTISLIGAFQLFDQAYVITNGVPGNATRTAVYQIYVTGFNRLQMGYAASQAIVLFVIILAVTVINLRVNRDYVAV